jgi:NAD(P)-dependent dehydrogenase (short-subunit alcohol dehydrogenase family)
MEMARRVEGKAAIVVGGGQTPGQTIGNGRAVAMVLAREGARMLAAANAQYGVRANTILPGLMNTPMAIEARVAKGTPREEVIASRDQRVPLRRRMGTGWDVAYAALYLHSDEAGFVTGVSLAVDGGEGVSWGS